MIDALEPLSKGTEMMAHSLVLVRKKVAELQAANEAATQQKSYKRKRIQKEGTLTVADGILLTTLKEFGVCSDGRKAKKRARADGGELTQRCCSKCGETGHNKTICKKDVGIVFT
jgi:hypothetical protein